jgi:hypothetical protein
MKCSQITGPLSRGCFVRGRCRSRYAGREGLLRRVKNAENEDFLGPVRVHNPEHTFLQHVHNVFISHQLRRQSGCLLSSGSGVRFTPGALPYSPRNWPFSRHPRHFKFVAILYSFTPF